MASLAANAISSSTGVAPHAPGAKTHNKTKDGESFADILDAAGDAAGNAAAPDDKGAQAAPAAQPPVAKPVAEAGEDAHDDIITDMPAIPPLTLAALPQPAARPQAAPGREEPEAAAGHDTDKPANDNDDQAAAQPVMAQPLPPQPAAVAPQAPKEEAVAATDAAAPRAVPPQANAPQQADNTRHDDGAEAEAGPDAVDAAPRPATPKPAKAVKPAADFKAMVNDAKAAPARTDGAKAEIAKPDGPKPDTTPAQNNSADAAAPARLGETPAAHHNGPAQTDLPPAAAPAQAAAADTARTIASTPVHETAAPRHAPNLSDLAVEITARSQTGAKQFDIRLDPPELGRVEVRLSIDATGKAQAHLTADQPQTLDLLQKDASSLTRALREAGLDVNPDGLNFSLRQQQQQAGQDQHMPGGRAARASFTAPAPVESVIAPAASRGPGLGLLDIRV